MPVLTRNVTLLHRLQKSSDATEIHLRTGDQVTILKEWAEHYLIKTPDGKVFNVRKENIDPSS